MTLPQIFCPKCDTLVLKNDTCSKCDWQRPLRGINSGKVAWAEPLRTKLPRHGTQPLADQQFVYLTTESGRVIALDTLAKPPARLHWNERLPPDYTTHSVALWKGQIVVGAEYRAGLTNQNGALLCFDANTGQEINRYPIEGTSLSVPAIYGNLACFTTNKGWAYLLNLETGDCRPQALSNLYHWSPTAPLISAEGQVILSTRGPHLLAYQLESMYLRALWHFSVPQATATTRLSGSPQRLDDMLYVRAWDKHIYAIDAHTGDLRWQYKPPRDINSDPWVHGDYLYVGVKDFKDTAQTKGGYALYILNRQTGELVNRYRVEGHIKARPTANDAGVYFATDERHFNHPGGGIIYGLTPDGGAKLWEPVPVEARVQSDLLLCGDLIIAGSREGVIYAVRHRENRQPEHPETYLEQGDTAAAAVAHAWRGNYTAAADLYRKIGQGYAAGQLYFKAKAYYEAVDSLKNLGQLDEARHLAIGAAQAIKPLEKSALVLVDLEEFELAGDAYAKAEDWFKAGLQYRLGAAIDKAIDAFAEIKDHNPKAENHWRELNEKLEKFDELINHHLEREEYASAAKIYLTQRKYLQAAQYYDLAGQAENALNAYRKADLSQAEDTAALRHFIAQLAESLGEWDYAQELYTKLGVLEAAARIAETCQNYEDALRWYQQTGQTKKTAQMYEKLGRHLEAASTFATQKLWAEAAHNYEQHALQVYNQLGPRKADKHPLLIEWLSQAIDYYEEETKWANEAKHRELLQAADRCTARLGDIRGEPLLKLELETEGLVQHRSNAIRYSLQNVGRGIAKDILIELKGDNLKEVIPRPIDRLSQKQGIVGFLTVTPQVAGPITLLVTVREGKAQQVNQFNQVVEVAANEDVLSNLLQQGGHNVTFNIQKYVASGGRSLDIKDAAIVNRGTLWEESASQMVGLYESEVFYPGDLKDHHSDSDDEEAPPQFCTQCGHALAEALRANPQLSACPMCDQPLAG